MRAACLLLFFGVLVGCGGGNGQALLTDGPPAVAVADAAIDRPLDVSPDERPPGDTRAADAGAPTDAQPATGDATNSRADAASTADAARDLPADAAADVAADAARDLPAPDAGTTDATPAGDASCLTGVPGCSAEPPAAGAWHELGGSNTGKGLCIGAEAYACGQPVMVLDGALHPVVLYRGAINMHQSTMLRRWNGTAWEQLGASASNEGFLGSFPVGLALARDGKPVAAGSSNPARVRRWTGRVWDTFGRFGQNGELVGPIAGHEDRFPQGQMVIDSQDRAVVAWVHGQRDGSDRVVSSSVHLKRWNGTAWEELGGSGTGTGLSPAKAFDDEVTLALDHEDRPVLAWTHRSPGEVQSALVIQRWSGTAWQAVAAPDAGVKSWTYSPRLVRAPDGAFVLAFGARIPGQPVGESYPDVMLVVSDGNGWKELGGSATGGGLSRSGRAGYPEVAVDERGRITVLWQSSSYNLYLRRWNGQAWQELGEGSATAGVNGATHQSRTPALASRGGRTCVAWQELFDDLRLRCFTEPAPGCACDATAACDTGCACDPGCAAAPKIQCPEGQLWCDDGTCLPRAQVCDGKPHCQDRSDESPLCPGGALADQPRGDCKGAWVCGDGSCVSGSFRCDREVDCKDGSDEDAVCDAPSEWSRESSPPHIDITGLVVTPAGTWRAVADRRVLRRQPAGWAFDGDAGGAYSGAAWAIGPDAVLVYADSIGLWRLTAGVWSLESFPAYVGGFWGAGAANLWAVGSALGPGGYHVRPTTYHYDGQAWTEVMPPGLSSELRGVWGSGAGDLWAVGDGGAIVHGNGTSWTAVPSNTTNRLRAVWVASASRAWAVGDAGTMLRFTQGTGWEVLPPITAQDFYSVWGTGPNDVWAVGANGLVAHYDGDRWRNVWGGTVTTLRSVRGAGPTTFLVGNESVVMRRGPVPQ